MRRTDGPSGPLCPAVDAQASRRLVTRLAVVAVQGEQLQSLCDELTPLLQHFRRDPELQASAALLASVLAEVAGVARDIALVTESLGSGLQQARPHQAAVSVPRKV